MSHAQKDLLPEDEPRRFRKLKPRERFLLAQAIEQDREEITRTGKTKVQFVQEFRASRTGWDFLTANHLKAALESLDMEWPAPSLRAVPPELVTSEELEQFKQLVTAQLGVMAHAIGKLYAQTPGLAVPESLRIFL